MLTVDAIIPTLNRQDMLKRCLFSLIFAYEMASEKIRLKIHICASGQAPDLAPLLTRLGSFHSEVTFHIIYEELPLSAGAARNRLLPQALGDWLYFIDDDAYVDPDFFNRFCHLLGKAETATSAVVGGPNLTPLTSSTFQKASGLALASRFGAGGVSRRYSSKTAVPQTCGEESLISCNLLIRRSSLLNLRFPESVASNEENLLLQDLIRQGRKMLYAPDLFVWHERRSRFREFARQMYRYGLGRGQNIRVRPWTIRYFHLLPALSLLVTLTALASLPWITWPIYIWLSCVTCYFVLLFGAFFSMIRRTNESLICFIAALLFPVIHVAYGAGVLQGIRVSPFLLKSPLD